MLGFNDTSTLVGHFVSIPRETEEIVKVMKERNREKKRNRNESEEREEIITLPLYPYLLQE